MTGFYGVTKARQSAGKQFGTFVAKVGKKKIGNFHTALDAALASDKTKHYLGKGGAVQLNFTNYSQVPDPVSTSGQTLTNILAKKYGKSKPRQ